MFIFSFSLNFFNKGDKSSLAVIIKVKKTRTLTIILMMYVYEKCIHPKYPKKADKPGNSFCFLYLLKRCFSLSPKSFLTKQTCLEILLVFLEQQQNNTLLYVHT